MQASAPRAARFDRAGISKGLEIFFGLSVASIAMIFMFTDRGKTAEALSRIEPLYLLLALLIAAADWCGGGCGSTCSPGGCP